jgi:hypothetical protein
VDEDLNCSPIGGLQPGEYKEFKFTPNQFGPWGEAPKDRTDMALTVMVKHLDGADGKELFPCDFSEADAKRLATLERVMHFGSNWRV